MTIPRMKAKHVIYVLLHLLLVAIGAFMARFGETSTSIGLSIVAAGVSGLVVLVYVLFDQRKAERLELLEEFGLEAAFRFRSMSIREEYAALLQRADFRIDALGFGLSALLQDFGPAFPAWKAKAHVRILLLDPDFPTTKASYANQRDREEGSDPDSIRRAVRRFVREVVPLLDNRFQVRLYRCIPTLNVFRVDGRLFFGPYLIGGPSRNQPTFLLREGGVLFNVVLEHFERIWNDDQLSRGIPDGWLDDNTGAVPSSPRSA